MRAREQAGLAGTTVLFWRAKPNTLTFRAQQGAVPLTHVKGILAIRFRITCPARGPQSFRVTCDLQGKIRKEKKKNCMAKKIQAVCNLVSITSLKLHAKGGKLPTSSPCFSDISHALAGTLSQFYSYFKSGVHYPTAQWHEVNRGSFQVL